MVFKPGVALQKVLEHFGMRRAVIQNGVKHKVVIYLHLFDVLPGAHLRVYGLEVDHCKTLVRGIGKEGKEVNGIDCSGIVHLNGLV